MTDGNGKIVGVPPDNSPPETLQKQEDQKPKDLVLTVTILHATGQLQVQGPGNGQIYDEPMCFYLLEKAKDWIKAANARSLQPKIVKPNGIMNFARGGFRK